jgi:hypothetical protein
MSLQDVARIYGTYAFFKICGLRWGFCSARIQLNLQTTRIPTPIRDLQVARVGCLLELLLKQRRAAVRNSFLD